MKHFNNYKKRFFDLAKINKLQEQKKKGQIDHINSIYKAM